MMKHKDWWSIQVLKQYKQIHSTTRAFCHDFELLKAFPFFLIYFYKDLLYQNYFSYIRTD
jgi:hypothetical protein